MNAHDPNVQTVELVVAALGPLTRQLVLVGGCSVGLLISDRARPPVRQTIDVDLIAEVASTMAYYRLCGKLTESGFSPSHEAEHMCRWVKQGLMIDVMPSDESILGHSANRWYPYAIQSARPITLPSGAEILLISAPLFLATKLEAFHDRGKEDYGHHDMEDIINLVDGRPELIDEVAKEAQEVREYLRAEFDDLLADESFTNSIPLHLRPDIASQARTMIILRRLQKLAGL